MIGLLSRTAAGVVLMCLVAVVLRGSKQRRRDRSALRRYIDARRQERAAAPDPLARPAQLAGLSGLEGRVPDRRQRWAGTRRTRPTPTATTATGSSPPGSRRAATASRSASRPRMEGRLSGRQSLASWPRHSRPTELRGSWKHSSRGRYLGSHRRQGRLEDPRSVRGYQLHRRRLLPGRATPGARRDLHEAEQQGRGQRLVPGQERARQLPLDRRGRHAHPHALRSRPLHRWERGREAAPRLERAPGTKPASRRTRWYPAIDRRRDV